jgi:hypothetical protein
VELGVAVVAVVVVRVGAARGAILPVHMVVAVAVVVAVRRLGVGVPVVVRMVVLGVGAPCAALLAMRVAVSLGVGVAVVVRVVVVGVGAARAALLAVCVVVAVAVAAAGLGRELKSKGSHARDGNEYAGGVSEGLLNGCRRKGAGQAA